MKAPATTERPSRVWIFDINRRVYTKPNEGKIYEGAKVIWREHWREHSIVDETSRSWITDWREKIPKKNPDPRKYLFSEAELDRQAWLHDHKHKIIKELEKSSDVDLFRRLAKDIGYE